MALALGFPPAEAEEEPDRAPTDAEEVAPRTPWEACHAWSSAGSRLCLGAVASRAAPGAESSGGGLRRHRRIDRQEDPFLGDAVP
ncbi:hypothetical protein H696_02549 [Fonticula alba]|uniref:Uncharacterized protein n=1 Tax=Fonticula alba TaxID=691883 RepID=A0A058Z9L6_FONAL|nr:hypothetical protein H696_02549 [Fonticula alba]KCV70222.1 hypothetical protein H696_02549 [Fonticula alba]|eukprot:XP_009494738.1 hypothetical protein H696_02549 [Fonticula alba]